MSAAAGSAAARLPTGRAGQALAALIALILLALLWFGVAGPLIGWYQARAAANQQRAVLLAHERALAAILPALERVAGRTAAVPAEAGAYLNDATGAIAGATLQQLLQTMTAASGATLASTEALPPDAAGLYQRIPLRVSVTGSWPAIVGLLQAIALSRPAMLVDDMDITSQPVLQSGAPPIDATFTVIAFRDTRAHP